MYSLYTHYLSCTCTLYSEHPCTWNKSSKPCISSSVIVTCIISIEREKGVCVMFYFSQHDHHNLYYHYFFDGGGGGGWKILNEIICTGCKHWNKLYASKKIVFAGRQSTQKLKLFAAGAAYIYIKNYLKIFQTPPPTPPSKQ